MKCNCDETATMHFTVPSGGFNIPPSIGYVDHSTLLHKFWPTSGDKLITNGIVTVTNLTKGKMSTKYGWDQLCVWP